MKRILDIFFSIFFLIIFCIPMVFISLIIKISSKGPIIYKSSRVGKNENLFFMPKFRSMVINSPNVATHKFKNPEMYFTPIGNFLRRTSLDELPQLWSILKGDMSFVGPRPALFNQKDLILKRKKLGIHKIKPGLTGLAQINGRDELSIDEKVKFDHLYLINQNLLYDFKIILQTVYKILKKEGVSH